MLIHQCDICGKTIGVWVSVSVEPNAAFVLSNVGHLIEYSGEYEICEECFENLLKKTKYETVKLGCLSEEDGLINEYAEGPCTEQQYKNA